MAPFDSRLKSQHDGIRASAETLAAIWKNKDLLAFKNECLHLGELIHQHDKAEWDLLFLPYSRRCDFNQGGPYCGYFFDAFIMNRPREKAIQLLRARGQNGLTLTDFHIDEHFQELFKANSMLSVPLEEHIAIKLILDTMIQSLNTNRDTEPLWINKCLEFLTDLIKKNIEKEETCLWALIQQSCMKEKS